MDITHVVDDQIKVYGTVVNRTKNIKNYNVVNHTSNLKYKKITFTFSLVIIITI